MAIFGKIIGFFLGYIVLAPLGLGAVGAVLGLIAGSFFDRGLKLHFYQTPKSHSVPVQQAFFMATFSVMGHLAKADGRVSLDEIRAAEQIMSRLEVNDDLRREAIRLFSEGKNANFRLESSLDLLYQECHRHYDLLRFFVEIQLEAALADGELTSEEKNILLYICKKLHIPASEFHELWTRQWASQAFYQHYNAYQQQSKSRHYQQDYSRGRTSQSKESSLKDAYGVLGVPMDASVSEIKKSYRKLMNQHHPDKLISRGLPEGMTKLAKEKTQQIRAAYDLIRNDRNFK